MAGVVDSEEKVRRLTGGGDFDDGIVWMLDLGQRDFLDGDLERSLVVQGLHCFGLRHDGTCSTGEVLPMYLFPEIHEMYSIRTYSKG